MGAFEGVISGVVCLGLFVALIVWIVSVASKGGRLAKLEETVKQLQHRVRDLERSAVAHEHEEPPAPAATAPRPHVRPATHPAPAHVEHPPLATEPPRPPARQEWIEARPAAAAGPPPLPMQAAVPLSRSTSARAAHAAPSSEPAPVEAAPIATAPVSKTPLRAAKTEVGLEAFLGGRVLLVVGVVVVLFGVGFFLKFAIDKGWIGPPVRIAMGVILGAGLLLGGWIMRRRAYDVFGQALMGCGLGALYLSNYYACGVVYRGAIDETAALGLAALVTALGVLLALRQGAPFLAYLGFVGGWLAPALLATPTGSLVGITAWMLIVDAGALAVLLRRAWRGLDAVALAFTTVYVVVWFQNHAPAQTTTAAVCIATLVFGSLALGFAPPIARRVRPSAETLACAAAAAALGILAEHELLFPAKRIELGVGVAVLAAAFLLASRLVAARVPEGRAESEGLLGYAAASLATAVALTFSGIAVTPALSAAGVAVVFAGARTRHPILLFAGVGTIALAFGDLFLNRLPMFDAHETPFLNERFFVFACPCAALLAAGRILSGVETKSAEPATLVGGLGLVLLPILLAVDLSLGFPGAEGRAQEMRVVAPTAALAVYGVLAARLFGSGTALRRAFALLPAVFALIFGLTLVVQGHHRAFSPFVNETFAAGLLVVLAAGFAAPAAQIGANRSMRAAGHVYLLALVTGELLAWGEAGARERMLAFDGVVVAWALWSAGMAWAESARRTPALSWLGVGDLRAERTLATLGFVGAAIWDAVSFFEATHPTAFANFNFGAGVVLVAAATAAAARLPDALAKAVRVGAATWLLALVTAELVAKGPTRGDLDAVVVAWSVWAAGLAWAERARETKELSWLGVGDAGVEKGLALMGLVGAVVWNVAALLEGPGSPFTPFVNAGFGAGLVLVAAAFVVAPRLAGGLADGARVAALAWLLALASLDIRSWGATCPVGDGTRAEAEFRAVVWMSIAWAVYASVLVGVGFWRRRAALRWMGLAVFALTLAKVFLVDMARLEPVYRIGSFLVLGALLVAASFLYQRSRRLTSPSGPSDESTG